MYMVMMFVGIGPQGGRVPRLPAPHQRLHLPGAVRHPLDRAALPLRRGQAQRHDRQGPGPYIIYFSVFFSFAIPPN